MFTGIGGAVVRIGWSWIGRFIPRGLCVVFGIGVSSRSIFLAGVSLFALDGLTVQRIFGYKYKRYLSMSFPA